MKKYTNVHVHKDGNFTVKSKFKNSVTLEEARERGEKDVELSPYLVYLGVLNVDVTTKQMNTKMKELQTS